jgi:hypothetical protein
MASQTWCLYKIVNFIDRAVASRCFTLSEAVRNLSALHVASATGSLHGQIQLGWLAKERSDNVGGNVESLDFRDIMNIFNYIWLRAGDNLAATSSHLGAERLLVPIDGRAPVAWHSQSRAISATDTSPVGELDCLSIIRTSFKVMNRIAGLPDSLKLLSASLSRLTLICCSVSLK